MHETRTVDPHSFFANPDQAFKKLPYEEFSEVEKDKKGSSKVKNP